MDRATCIIVSLQYFTALLLNLSFRSKGKDQFEQVSSKTVNLISELVDHPNQDIERYIKSTLYLLLNRNVFKVEATRQGLKDKLDTLMKQSNMDEAKK